MFTQSFLDKDIEDATYLSLIGQPNSDDINNLIKKTSTQEYPLGLIIDLSRALLKSEDAEELAKHLSSIKYSRKLKIILNNKPYPLEPLNALIIFADQLNAGKYTQMEGLEWFIQSHETSTIVIQKFANALKSNLCPKGFKLDLSGVGIINHAITELIDILREGQYPEGFQLNLSNKSLTHNNMTALFEALKSGQPNRKALHLTLSGNLKADQTLLKQLIEALKYDHCPEDLTLELNEHDLGLKGIKEVIKAIRENQFKPNLKINLLTRRAKKENSQEDPYIQKIKELNQAIDDSRQRHHLPPLVRSPQQAEAISSIKRDESDAISPPIVLSLATTIAISLTNSTLYYYKLLSSVLSLSVGLGVILLVGLLAYCMTHRKSNQLTSTPPIDGVRIIVPNAPSPPGQNAQASNNTSVTKVSPPRP